MITKKNTPTA
ncbi:hypothetical protein RB213_004612 [Colletotrichum asianum]